MKIVKKNPCKKCIVQTCCTETCEDKQLHENLWPHYKRKRREAILIEIAYFCLGLSIPFGVHILWKLGL